MKKETREASRFIEDIIQGFRTALKPTVIKDFSELCLTLKRLWLKLDYISSVPKIAGLKAGENSNGD